MKVLRIFLYIILILILISNVSVVKATGSEDSAVDIDTDSIIDGAEKFLHAGEGEDTPLDEADFKQVSDVIYNVLLVLGIVAAVIVGLIIAIKIITGSAGQKAETKELLIPYITGCVIIFGAFGIWKIVVNILNQTQA